MPNLPCAQCGQTKECRMFIDEHTKRPIYLCKRDALELGYSQRVAP